MRESLKRALSGVGWTVAILVLLLLVAHLIITPVESTDGRPESHPPGPCWACHWVRG